MKRIHEAENPKGEGWSHVSGHPARLLIIVAIVVTAILPNLARTTDVPAWPPALRAAVQSAICARNGFPTADVDITYHMTRVPDRCKDAATFRVEIPEFDDAIGPVTVQVRCDSAGLPITRVAVPIRVSIYARALVATRLLQPYAVISPEDVRRERFEVTKMLDWAVTDEDSVVGRRLLRTIGAGQALDRRALADVPLIRRGDRVTMTYASATVRVSTHAVAVEDGYPDQRIMVKIGDRQRLVPAMVVDADNVRPVEQ
jgi:flagella basal body P-ring formation protein FlgA